MPSIESRIVQMQFDNSAFERKLATTVQSLEKLNQTLSKSGSQNGLETISQSARNFTLGAIGTSIDGISAKFLALSTIAITALSNIVNRAVDAGIQLTKALSFDQITGGFREYELQIGSIQTILANTSADGTSLNEVNAALDLLNTYSDQTIYNFGEMTRNIGTFTAAGVDLDLSVQSIKGIANLAAISGSTSEQAATGMYQLSQAISTGSVRLMDWNSVVNAGMGGEVFQKALFATGQAMGTITDSPVGQTFEEWTAAGNTFRTSLDSGWLSAEVLTTTLQGFTGEMTEAQLVAKGFTQDQAQEMMRLGALGVDAATKVRTFSQLISTTKEAIGSGWAQSFRTIFGDFKEATTLFTDISGAIGGMIGRSADARNAMLADWKDLGGRRRLIDGLKNTFLALGDVFGPIKLAFRDIFPAQTGATLAALTERFQKFAERLRLSEDSIIKVRAIFRGLFSALEIGWTVIKEGAGFIKDLVSSFIPSGSGSGIVNFLKTIGDALTYLNVSLVLEGGIAKFFDNLAAKIKPVIEFAKDLAGAVVDLFKGFGGSGRGAVNAAGSALERFGQRFSGIKDVLGRIGNLWGPLSGALGKVVGILDKAWDAIREWFSELGSKMADALSPGDFDSAVDTVNVGLLGGIALLLRSFLKNGLSFNFGGGLFSGIKDSLHSLTGVLGAMQANLKANALLKIAAAIGILAISLLLLASINSDDLTRALFAMSIGFAQLIGAFALLDKMEIGVKSAATMNLVATSLILLAAAVLVLALAMKLFATMSWEDLAKGLVGVAGALTLLVGAAFLLSKVKGSLIGTGIGLMAIAVALVIMAGAVKLFSLMDWLEMAKGLVGVAGALTAIAIGMRRMPKGMLLQGAGLILIGAALNIIYLAVKQFGDMGWKEMGKGLAGIAGALVGIGIAVNLMPPTLPLIGLGLLLVSAALLLIVKAMENLATMSWEDIAKGLTGLRVALLGMSLAMRSASGAALGAVSLTIMVFAIQMLVDVLKEVGRMSWMTLAKGLYGIAAALAILGIAALVLTPAIPALLGLGAALLLIGAGFALFGIGVFAVAKGFEILANVGKKAAEALVSAMESIATSLPEFLREVAEGVLEFIQTFLEGLPVIIEQLVVIIGHILDGLTELIPKAAELIRVFIQEILATARTLFPDIVQTGFDLILAFLKGIRDNIGEIVVVVADIIIAFLDALALKIPEVIDAMYNFFIAVVEGVVAKLVDLGSYLLPKGLEMLQGLVQGLDDNKGKIADWLLELPGKILGWIGDALLWLVDKGGDVISGLLSGAETFVTETLQPWLEALPGKIFTWVGETIESLAVRGTNLIGGFYNAVINFVNATLIPWFSSLPSKIWGWIGDTFSALTSRGKDIIVGFYNAVINFVNETLLPWFKALPSKIWGWIGNTFTSLTSRGKDIIVGFYNAVINFVNATLIPWFTSLPSKIWGWIGDTISSLTSRGRNLMIGFYNAVINYVNSDLMPWFQSLPSKVWNWIGDTISSLTSRGRNIIAGFYNGVIAVINETVSPWFQNLDDKILSWIGYMGGILYDKGRAVITGFWDGMKSAWSGVSGWISDRAASVSGLFSSVLSILSPSKVMMEIGENTMLGFRIGMEHQWVKTDRWMNHLDPAASMQDGLTARMSNVISDMASQLDGLDEFHPTITPVLDLTQVQNGAKALVSMMPNASYMQAAYIASTSRPFEDGTTPIDTPTGEVKFEQNIYAPKQLSTGDIYKQTRNQIALAKEELSIP